MRAVHIDHIWRKKCQRWINRYFPPLIAMEKARQPLVHGSISTWSGFSLHVHDPIKESLQRQAQRRRALMKRANRRRARRQQAMVP